MTSKKEQLARVYFENMFYFESMVQSGRQNEKSRLFMRVCVIIVVQILVWSNKQRVHEKSFFSIPFRFDAIRFAWAVVLFFLSFISEEKWEMEAKWRTISVYTLETQ